MTYEYESVRLKAGCSLLASPRPYTQPIIAEDIAMACDNFGSCCICLLSIPAVFFFFISPWIAVGGPWVTYSLNTQAVDKSVLTINEFYLEYPMFLFDRQQYLGTMCFTRITLELWLAVFHKDPEVKCSSRSSSWGYKSYRSCRLTYCLSDWDVMTNNRTKFSHNVQLYANPSYYFSVTDACWWAWLLPALAFIFCDCSFTIPLVYTIVVFALRVAFSVASMVKFFDYNALTDPPHTGYLNSKPDVQAFTTWKYDYGFAFGWITLISNAIGFLGIVIAGVVYWCSSGNSVIDEHVAGWRTSSNRMTSGWTSRFGRKSSSDDTDGKPSASAGVDLDQKSDQPYKQLKEDTSGPRADYGTSGSSDKQWPSPPPYDASVDP